MIHFLFGGPGSGKTTALIRHIRHQLETASEDERTASPIYLLVPEQQAYSAERTILPQLPTDAGLSFEILSFSRLSDRVADRYGGRRLISMTQGIQSLLMWHTLRELHGLLGMYTAEPDAALTQEMCATIAELSANIITPTQLERVAGRVPDDHPLRKKLMDLSLIQASYHGLVTQIYGNDPADQLLRTAQALETHAFFQNASVFIDSFSSFTAQEYAIIAHLFRQARHVTVTLASDQRHSKEMPFFSINRTAETLVRLAEAAGCSWQDHAMEAHPAFLPWELNNLSRSLWQWEVVGHASPSLPKEGRGHVALCEASTIYEEARAAARYIREQVDRGVRYEDIAVIVRDLSDWMGVLDVALTQEQIPFFLSRRTKLNLHPASRILLIALRCIARRWRREDMLSLLKTGLCGVPLRDMDQFQDYIETWNLSGASMTQSHWDRNPDGFQTELSPRGEAILQAANRTRQAVMTPLLALEERLRHAKTVTDQCQALYGYLCDLDVREQLIRQAEQALAEDQVQTAGTLMRLWSCITESLVQMASLLDADHQGAMTPSDLETALSLLLMQTDIGSIPARHDCVLVGSASTLRAEHVDVALVLGLSEGDFPRAVSEAGLFTEQEKILMTAHGLTWNVRSDEQLCEELLYVHRAVTTPKNRLYLSYSRQRMDGRPQTPSIAFRRAQALLPHLTVRIASSPTPVALSANRTADQLSPALAHRLMGTRLWLSQSRLQTYTRCPFSYYGSYILNLREKQEAHINSISSGIFLHHVLEQFLKTTLDKHQRIRPLTQKEVEDVADRIIQAYLTDLLHGMPAPGGRLLHVFDRLRTIALSLISSILEELAQSSFAPYAMEWDTHGREPGDPHPLVLTLDPEQSPEHAVELILAGVIDRVDLYRTGDQIYIRVVDYKSSRHEFSEASIVKDMNIQLLLYLFTLCSPQNRALFATPAASDGSSGKEAPPQVQPAAAVYLSPEEDETNGQAHTVRRGVILDDDQVLQAACAEGVAFLPGVRENKQGRRMGKGLYSSEKLRELEQALYQAIRAAAADLYSGQAQRTPSATACRFCRLSGSCDRSVPSL